MAPATQTLYCFPNDLFDFMGVEGVQLRLDDHNLATGQVVTVTTNAVAGSLSLSIAALQFPLIKGTTLEFDGGGMEDRVEGILSATALVGATTLAVNALSDVVLANAQATDSGVNLVLAKLATKACNYGTDRVNRYCGGRYNYTDLATTWAANEWATTMGSEWMCRRLLRTLPETIKGAVEMAVKEMRMVQMGQMQVPGIGTRSACWPFIDNVTVNPAYTNHKIRLQQTISDPTPTQFGAYVDYSDALNYEL